MARIRPDSGFRAAFGFSGNFRSGRISVGKLIKFLSRVGRRSGKPKIFARMRSPARDTVRDSDLTDAWFDEEDEAVVSEQNETKDPASDTEAEDDYMTMDLSKF
jgi:hypothetical protein